MKAQKRINSFILTVLISMIMVLNTPLSFCEQAAWDCPECGRISNTGNFCGGCGHTAPWLETPTPTPTPAPTPPPTPTSSPTPAPTSTPTSTPTPTPTPTSTPRTVVTLADTLEFNHGVTTIRWSVDGKEAVPYEISISLLHDKGAKQQVVISSSTALHEISTDSCLPGKTYCVTIRDATGNEVARRNYLLDDPDRFEDDPAKKGTITVSTKTNLMKDGKSVKSFSAGELNKNYANSASSTTYYFQIPVKWKQTGTYLFTCAVESPNGFLHVGSKTISVNRGTSNTIDTKTFFSAMYEAVGSITPGEYHVMLYIDGALLVDNTVSIGK